jgi:hypothetical protein
MERDTEIQAKLRDREGTRGKKEKVRRMGRQESSSSFHEKQRWSMEVCGVKGQHGPHKDRQLVTTGEGPFTLSKEAKQRFP